MITKVLADLFERDLLKASSEIASYSSEEALWQESGEISNPGGNLGLHLAGNIRHFFGAVLGGSGYVRERDLEFSSKGATRQDISEALNEAAGIARDVLLSITDDELSDDYPEPFAGETVSKAWMITHLLTHLNYHLGQINYHRRLGV